MKGVRFLHWVVLWLPALQLLEAEEAHGDVWAGLWRGVDEASFGHLENQVNKAFNIRDINDYYNSNSVEAGKSNSPLDTLMVITFLEQVAIKQPLKKMKCDQLCQFKTNHWINQAALYDMMLDIALYTKQSDWSIYESIMIPAIIKNKFDNSTNRLVAPSQEHPRPCLRCQLDIETLSLHRGGMLS